MKHINLNRSGLVVFALVLVTFWTSPAVRAEPPVHLSPRDISGLLPVHSILHKSENGQPIAQLDVEIKSGEKLRDLSTTLW